MENELKFKCTLLTDIVINANMATDRIMKTLDYIPGSNFWGIVASKLHSNEDDFNTIKQLVYSDEVHFGNAYPSVGSSASYPIPLSYFLPKLQQELVGAIPYIHHQTDYKLQLKQIRSGYMMPDGQLIPSVVKRFQLKSAYNTKAGTSQKSQMFGYESINQGTELVFSIFYKNEVNIEKIKEILTGIHRIGKSKFTEFGKVKIEPIKDNATTNIDKKDADYTLVYAKSNLCFFQNGLPCLQPTAEMLGLQNGGINWEQSQIRTFSYSPFNHKRNTHSQQRFCISKGSVFYVKGKVVSINHGFVGEYINEGFGHVLYNPVFLEMAPKYIKIKKTESEPKENTPNTNPTPFYNFLEKNKNEEDLNEKQLQAVYAILNANKLKTGNEDKEIVSKNQVLKLKEITKSQWSRIRSVAINQLDLTVLKEYLTGDKGILIEGQTADKHWKENINTINEIMAYGKKQNFNSEFMILFASEISKQIKK